MEVRLEHFISATSLDAVTGTFQEERMKTNLLTFLDECTFSGDKRQSSILKGLLSEAWRKWEAKFINPIRIRNFRTNAEPSIHERNQMCCVPACSLRALPFLDHEHGFAGLAIKLTVYFLAQVGPGTFSVSPHAPKDIKLSLVHMWGHEISIKGLNVVDQVVVTAHDITEKNVSHH